MVRSLTAIGIVLALVGSAHAQDRQVTVRLDGKSHRQVRSELYRAAQQVCASENDLNMLDSTCVEATYADAMHQLHVAPRVQQTAYIEASPHSIR